MKFHRQKFWKHRGDCCDFFEVIEVIEDNGETAIVKAAWHTQSNRSWRNMVPEDHFRIPKKDYDKFRAYRPRGERE